MDDRTFWLVVGVLGSTVFVVILAGIAHFDVPVGFWAIPGGVVTLLTVMASRGVGRNGNGRNGNGRKVQPPEPNTFTPRYSKTSGIPDEQLSDAEFILRHNRSRWE